MNKTEEIINVMDYINEFEKSYYMPIKTEFLKMDKHRLFQTEKEQVKYDKIKKQELFLGNMIKNIRSLIELSIIQEIENEKI
jgi:uncharacterized protein YktA (UPF0223 family)